ncbi:DUF2231 domain-containing protein [Arthrobacter mobilis]|uniref:DUF2231 domain-containing protein n=1 Tax=Arthrobacter mobilis TaxID=2724944 RepID=A0A7X6HAG4_9MICC|nr:DUF2231 domain-containing protein [Arthrobacter mobilis]NKX53010.1 DUF2231 domain-containing protein [Arthrobacter mobilis]
MNESSLQRAKRPRTALAGPYGHPFHAMLIPIPLGAWIASLVFDLVAIFTGEVAVFERGALWLIGIGIIGALAAAVFGFLDFSQLERGTRAHKTGLTHMALNLAVTALFVAGFLVRSGAGFDEISIAGFIISLVALALLGVSGYLGGELAYRYGVRVADEQTQREGFTR